MSTTTMFDMHASPRSVYHLPRAPPTAASAAAGGGAAYQPQQPYPESTSIDAAMAASASASASASHHQHPQPALRGGPYPDSRVYGRTKDLRKLADFRTPAAGEAAPAASSSTPADAGSAMAANGSPSPSSSGGGGTSFGLSLIGKTRAEPTFSVEVFAPAFDERGYPIIAGRAAALAANVRLSPSVSADIEVTTYAYTTAGSSAAVWDGVILLPSASSHDRNIFTVKDRFDTATGSLSVRSPLVGPPAASPPMASTPAQEDYILTVPIQWNLPVGASRAVVDGEAQTVHVALPPSYEVTRTEDDGSGLGTLTSGGGGGSSSSGASSFSSSMSTTSGASLWRLSPPGSSSGTATPGAAPTLSTLTPSHPHRRGGGGGGGASTGSTKKSRARTVRGMVEKSLESVTRLGCFYVMEFALIARTEAEASANGGSPKVGSAEGPSGKKDKAAAKKGLDKNAAPRGRVLDSISIPFIFAGEQTTLPLPAQALPPTLRPQLLSDPDAKLAQDWQRYHVVTKWTGMMLKALRRGIQLDLHLPTGPAFHAPSAIPFLLVIRPSDASLLPPAPPRTPPDSEWRSQFGSPSTVASSILRRPATAPTVVTNASPTGSSLTRVTTTTSTALGQAGTVDLTRVVRVSLVQVMYSTTPNVNDLPVRKRRIMSVAQEVEEVDLAVFLPEEGGAGAGVGGEGAGAGAGAGVEAVEEARRAGVRVLAGKLRISPHVTPSFRSQGIEVKYAVKVDLLPFSGSGGGGGSGTGANASSASSTHAVASSGASTSGRSEKEGVGATLSSAMRSLRLKTSTSRFVTSSTSYAGSIFSSGKSRRSRGFSDGNAAGVGEGAQVEDGGGGWSTTDGVQSGTTSGVNTRPGSSAAHTLAGARSGHSPPDTPSLPWATPSSSQAPSQARAQSGLPRSVSEGAGLGHRGTPAHGGDETPSGTFQGHHAHANGGVVAAAASSSISDELDSSNDAGPGSASARTRTQTNGTNGHPNGVFNPDAAHSSTDGAGAPSGLSSPVSGADGATGSTMNAPSSWTASGKTPSQAHSQSHHNHNHTDAASQYRRWAAAAGAGPGAGASGSPAMSVSNGNGAGGAGGSSTATPTLLGAHFVSRTHSGAPSTFTGTTAASASAIQRDRERALAAAEKEERAQLAKLHKTAGALWVDIRVVRGWDAPVAPAPAPGVVGYLPPAGPAGGGLGVGGGATPAGGAFGASWGVSPASPHPSPSMAL